MFNFLLGFFHLLSFFFFPSHQLPNGHHPGGGLSPTPIVIISPSPTTALTPTDTPAIFQTPTPTNMLTLTPTMTVVPTATPTTMPTETPTIMVTPTDVPTTTPTQTPTPTIIPTMTPLPTLIPTLLPTDQPTPTIMFTPTAVPTATMTPTPSPTPTVLPTATPTNTPTPIVTLEPTATEMPTPTSMLTPTASPTPTLSLTPTPTATPTPTISEAPIPTPTETPTPTKIGNDISYPQCGNTYPSGQGFGIVGVNDGIATTTNPCLSSELQWANASSGTVNQSNIQICVNTGNPGGLNTASWPSNNTDPLGNGAPNPDGTCDGSDSTACAWQYGWNRAVDDVANKFVPAAQSAGISTDPSSYPWWLDVETVNSWESGGSTSLQSNEADLEAMVTYFKSKGITVGIYSTSYQWGQIVGSLPSGSDLNGLHSWLPGASDLAGAQSNCQESALTTNGSVTMTQYTMNAFDYDYSCL